MFKVYKNHNSWLKCGKKSVAMIDGIPLHTQTNTSSENNVLYKISALQEVHRLPHLVPQCL